MINIYYIFLSLSSVGYGDEISMPKIEFEQSSSFDLTLQFFVMIFGMCMFAYFSSRIKIVLD